MAVQAQSRLPIGQLRPVGLSFRANLNSASECTVRQSCASPLGVRAQERWFYLCRLGTLRQ